MKTEPVIEIDDLTRYFGTKCAVGGVSFTIPRGSVFGFLGRNGSGKTTTIRMLLGLLEPTRGSSRILGHDSQDLPPEVRAKIGYMAEGHHLHGWMKVKECRAFQRAFYEPHWDDILFEGVIEHFGLAPDAKVNNLSRGQRAGLCLALTLATCPEVLVLDDPALGLDPVARRLLLESMVYVTRDRQRTILFSSHLLSDVERVADQIAVMEHGVLRAFCGADTFRERVRRLVLHFESDRPPNLPPIPGLLTALRDTDTLTLTIANFDEHVEAQLDALGPSRIERIEINLEEAFIGYMGERGERRSFYTALGGAK